MYKIMNIILINKDNKQYKVKWTLFNGIVFLETRLISELP